MIRYVKHTRFNGNLLLAAAAVYVDCFENSEWQERWPLEDAIAVFLKAMDAGSDIFLAMDDEKEELVVGFAIGHPMAEVAADDHAILIGPGQVPPDSYWIRDIGVFRPYRKHHVAKELVHRLLGSARTRGFDTCATRTMVGCAGETLFFRSDFASRGEFEFVTGGHASKRYVLVRDVPTSY